MHNQQSVPRRVCISVYKQNKKKKTQTKNKLKGGTQIDIETEEFAISAYYLCHHLIL